MIPQSKNNNTPTTAPYTITAKIACTVEPMRAITEPAKTAFIKYQNIDVKAIINVINTNAVTYVSADLAGFLLDNCSYI